MLDYAFNDLFTLLFNVEKEASLGSYRYCNLLGPFHSLCSVQSGPEVINLFHA